MKLTAPYDECYNKGYLHSLWYEYLHQKQKKKNDTLYYCLAPAHTLTTALQPLFWRGAVASKVLFNSIMFYKIYMILLNSSYWQTLFSVQADWVYHNISILTATMHFVPL